MKRKKSKDPKATPERSVARRRPRIPRDEALRGLILLHTGDGKGKTSAALGMLLRAAGHGMRAAGFQFIKSKDRAYGEHKACARLGIRLEPLGDGFTWLSKDLAADRAFARECWAKCAAALRDETIEILLLDEITYPVNYRWLSEREVVAAIRRRPKRMHVILTGRDASRGLMRLADTATEMRKIKHAYDAGHVSRRGIEL